MGNSEYGHFKSRYGILVMYFLETSLGNLEAQPSRL